MVALLLRHVVALYLLLSPISPIALDNLSRFRQTNIAFTLIGIL
jgi:hypothetical protein